MVAAVAATVYVVIAPAIHSTHKTTPVSAGSKTPSVSVSSQPSSSSSAVSSAPASSSAIASSAVSPGSYDYFKDAVFIGDSLTSGVSEYSMTKNAGVFASNGMSTSSALTKNVTVGGKSMSLPDAVKTAKPAKVYLLLGSNDISWMKEDTFITYYGKLIDTLKTGTPNAVFYVQSIFPVSAAYEKSSGVSNDKIDDFNGRLAQLCSQKGVKYVDVGSGLKGSDGKLLPAAAADGYNIKKAYYKTWLDYLTMHE